MKSFLPFAILCISHLALAQAADSLYLVTYSLGSAWDMSKSPQDQVYFKEHSGHLSKLRSDGVISAGARYSDKGMIFIKSRSLKDALAVINSDQAVINNLFRVEVHKIQVFYEGCLERPK
ncbi:MAG: hypothetical protein AB7K37_10125 [Cyclobacteriaceae bacterium]